MSESEATAGNAESVEDNSDSVNETAAPQWGANPRRRRNRQRETLVKEHAGKHVRVELDERVSDASVEVENADFFHAVELKLDAGSFALLKRIANNTAYSQLAAELGVSEASLRTKVCRIREDARLLAA